jgi:hypothetical protein
MATWQEEAARVGCTCTRSDSWRCANTNAQPGRISCGCPCHRYIDTQTGGGAVGGPKPAGPKRKER